MEKKTGLMEIAFSNGVVMADAKTGMVNLKTLEVVGNLYNGVSNIRDKSYRRLDDWLRFETTKEFIKVCEENNPSRLGLIQTGAKRGKKTWASIHIAVDFAMWLNPQFKYEVIDTFVNKRILDFRLYGIDNHKELNKKLDMLDGRIGKDNKGLYINTAKMINEKVKGKFKKGWDEKEEIAEQQQYRDNIQKELMMLIEKGYIKTWGDVKDYFTK